MLQRVAIDMPLNVLVAGMVLASLPMVALFLAFQRQILAGLTAGSIKG
jgi:multiple sugar transport system permease protein